MKLLIVGGTGVLSLAVTNEALAKSIEVYMLNRGNRMHLLLAGFGVGYSWGGCILKFN